MSKKNQHQDPEQSVEHALNTTEHFIEKNKKTLLYSAIAIIAIAAIGFAYQHLYRKPLINEALAQTFMAEQYFRSDSFALALNGDGNSLGFAQIIDEYGSKAGESVYMYAGISELQLGNYEKAISYLKKYDGKDPVMKARSISNIGDAYAGMENFKEALSFYLKAADFADNTFAAGYLLKAGIMYEELGDTAKAVETYKIIKDKYPQSVEGYDIDKYISRLTL
ncbi:MAG: tetratricopeptide repeat protein [Bacteroidales bacterium]